MDEESVFAAALDKTPTERAAFLDGVGAADLELRAKVASLLQAHEDAGGFLQAHAAEQVTVDNPPILERAGSMVGPYKLMEEIGEGGFGLVFVAEQHEPMRRKVALKIIKPGMDSKEIIARFEAERQALALMDHPNIARILDAGTTNSGRPYFVMELVKGIPVVDYCDQQRLTTRERLELFTSVCQAVQHAHSKGIIHRDLKPSNILVAPHDGIPVVKIIDFGIAKAIGQQLTNKTVYTRFAQMIGTPLYMSPEQAEVNALDVDTRSDIYSLGVLLYELLTGTTPFDRERFATAAHDELLRIIREEDPPKPSKRLSTLGKTLTVVSAKQRTQPARLSALVKGDLDWIVMKALEKDRTRRYATAIQFASDVQRFLRHEPVEAHSPSAAYRLRKFARRNSVAFTTAFVVAFALLLGIVGTTWQAIRATEAEKVATNSLKSEQGARGDAEVSRNAMQQERDRAELLAEQRRFLQYIADMNSAWEAWEQNDVRRAGELLERYVPQHGAPDLRSIEWHFLRHSCDESLRVERRILLSYGAMRVTISPQDRKLVVGLHNNSIDIVDRKTGANEQSLGPANRIWYPTYVQFSKDGTLLLAPAADTRNISVRQWPSRAVIRELCGHTADVRAVSVSPNDQLLASADEAGEIIIWNLADGTILHREAAHTKEVLALAFSRKSLRLASGSLDGTVKVWRWTGTRLEIEMQHEEHFHQVCAVAFSHDDKLLASGGLKEIILWDTVLNKRRLAIDAHADQLRTLEFSSDDKVLLSASRDKTVKLWDVETGAQLLNKRAHSSITTAATFLDDQTVASVGFEGTLAIWTVDRKSEVTRLSLGSPVKDLAFSTDSRNVYALRLSPRAIIKRNLETGVDEVLPDCGSAQTIAVCESGGQEILACGDETGRIALRRLDTLEEVALLAEHHSGAIYQVVATTLGDKLASYGAEGAVKVWDTRNRQLLTEHHFEPPKDPGATEVGILAFSPDGQTLAWADGLNRVTLLDLRTGQLNHLTHDKYAVVSITFSPDNRILATADWHGTIRLWDLRESAPTRADPRKIQVAMWARALTFSPDGKTLLVASGEGTLRCWDLQTLQQKCAVASSASICLRFSPDGKKLAGGGFSGTVSIMEMP